jgi:hypothetical protein
MSGDTPLNLEQKDAFANAEKNPSTAESINGYDLSRSYGRNWTKTNVTTLFDWITSAAFNMQCLEYAIDVHRRNIRNFTIYGLIVSTLSGTLSLSQFGIEQGHVSNKILQGIFTFLTFSLAIYTGYVKIYQIQERLEQFLKLRQDWVIFATSIGSELQIPIELRRDALYLIVKYKTIYLDLIKINIEIPESLRIRAEQSLPKIESHIQVTNLPSTIINIGIAELDDLNEERRRDKDRFSLSKQESQTKNSEPVSVVKQAKPEKNTQNNVISPSLSPPPPNIIATITSTPIAVQQSTVDVAVAAAATGATGLTGSSDTAGSTGPTGTNHLP